MSKLYLVLIYMNLNKLLINEFYYDYFLFKAILLGFSSGFRQNLCNIVDGSRFAFNCVYTISDINFLNKYRDFNARLLEAVRHWLVGPTNVLDKKRRKPEACS